MQKESEGDSDANGNANNYSYYYREQIEIDDNEEISFINPILCEDHFIKPQEQQQQGSGGQARAGGADQINYVIRVRRSGPKRRGRRGKRRKRGDRREH